MPRRIRTKSDVGSALPSEARNPLLDDLPDDLDASVRGVAAGEQGSQTTGTSMLMGDILFLRSPSSSLGATNHAADDTATTGAQSGHRASASESAGKLGISAVYRAAKHFVHLMHMHHMDVYFSDGGDQAKEEGVKRVLDGMQPQERASFVLSMLEILEEIRLERGRIGQLRGGPEAGDAVAMERPLSSSIVSNMSTASLARPPVHETHEVAMRWDTRGNVMINRYTILASLGRGAYGHVKLGEEVDTGRKVAIKIISKKRLKKKMGYVNGEYDDALSREIAIMKKVRHRNCVALYEVIDDPDSQRLYLIMDYIPNGPVVRLQPQRVVNELLAAIEAGQAVDGVVYNQYLVRCAVRQTPVGADVALSAREMAQEPMVYMCRPLRQTLCANYLRQLVSGLRYMHKRNVVHHDIKPDNILLGYNAHIYLTDFGVSEIMESGDASEMDDDHGIAQSTSGASADDAAAATNASPRHDEDDEQEASMLSGDATRRVGGAVHGTTRLRRGGNAAYGARRGAGTLLFTAPELFEMNVDPSRLNPFATDVWALGVTLYCMLVGCAPFNGQCYADVAHNVQTQAVPWNGMNLHSRYLIPQWLTILEGLLEKDPAKRWLLVDVKNYLDGDEFQNELRLQSAMEMSQTGGNQSMTKVALAAAAGPTSSTSATTADHAHSPHDVRPARRAAVSQLRRHTLSAQLERMSIPLNVSAREVREALVRQRVEVMPKKKPLLSAHARDKVHNFVTRLRQRRRARGLSVSVSSNAYARSRPGASLPHMSSSFFSSAGHGRSSNEGGSSNSSSCSSVGVNEDTFASPTFLFKDIRVTSKDRFFQSHRSPQHEPVAALRQWCHGSGNNALARNEPVSPKVTATPASKRVALSASAQHIVHIVPQPSSGGNNSSNVHASATLDAMLQAANLQSYSTRSSSSSLSTTFFDGAAASTARDGGAQGTDRRARPVVGGGHTQIKVEGGGGEHTTPAHAPETAQGVHGGRSPARSLSDHPRLLSSRNMSDLFTDTMPQKLLCQTKLGAVAPLMRAPGVERAHEAQHAVVSDRQAEGTTVTSTASSPPMTAWEEVAAVPTSELTRRGWRARVSMRR